MTIWIVNKNHTYADEAPIVEFSAFTSKELAEKYFDKIVDEYKEDNYTDGHPDEWCNINEGNYTNEKWFEALYGRAKDCFEMRAVLLDERECIAG